MTQPNHTTLAAVRQTLQQFQEAYIARDVAQLDRFVAELLTPEAELVFIGTGDSEWCFGRESAREIFEGDWEGWGDVRIDLDAAHISALGDVAWFALPGTVSQKIDPEQFCKGTLSRIRSVIADENAGAEEKVVEILRATSITLLESEKGAEYIWPFRLTGVLVRRGPRWQFHQIQFSFPTTTTPDERIPSPDLHAKPMVDFPRTLETEAVRAALQAFQDGYTRRDVAELDAFMTLFAPDDDLLIVGTGDNEWQSGRAEARELVEGDWLHWGQLSLDVDRAMISQEGDVAWLATHGLVTRHVPREKSAQNLLAWLDVILKSELEPKQALLEILRPCAYLYYGFSQGEEYYFPLRFTAVLIRRDERWLFHHMQFSFGTLRTPDERRGGLWQSPRD